MTSPKNQPSLAELTERMLQRQVIDGIEFPASEVEPHEMLSGLYTDPRTAYTDALLPLKLLGVSGLPVALPPDWAAFAQLAATSPAVPMAAGAFPQQVRELSTLLTTEVLNELRPQTKSEPVSGYSALRNWAKKNLTVAGMNWLAAGVARRLGDSVELPTGTDPVSQNERAAALWLSGKTDEAVNVWLAMPDSPVASFNRGMGLLFTGKKDAALAHLRRAAAELPDTCGWNHLAQLYLSIAIMH
jgi:hypothetical protein